MSKEEDSREHMFLTLKDVYKASLHWYGDTSMDSCCLAENRLMRGEKPNTPQEKE